MHVMKHQPSSLPQNGQVFCSRVPQSKPCSKARMGLPVGGPLKHRAGGLIRHHRMTSISVQHSLFSRCDNEPNPYTHILDPAPQTSWTSTHWIFSLHSPPLRFLLAAHSPIKHAGPRSRTSTMSRRQNRLASEKAAPESSGAASVPDTGKLPSLSGQGHASKPQCLERSRMC
jgi:hypothetical protein